MNRHRHPAGFSLLEVMIVVSIIAVLVGLVFVAGQSWANEAKVQSTRVTLTQLKQAMDTWRTNLSGKQVFSDRLEDITVARNTAFAKWETTWNTTQDLVATEQAHNNAARWLYAFSLVNELTSLVTQFPQERRGDNPVLRDLRPDLDVTAANAKGLLIVDGFARPIMLIQVPGRDIRSGQTAGIPQFEIEASRRFGIGEGNRYYFLSAGADGQFGNNNGTAEEKKQAGDNLNSLTSELN